MKIPQIIMLPPNRVWRTYPGGKTLDIMEGKSDPEDTHFPEDWIGSTTRAINIGREEMTEEGLAMVDLDEEHISLKALCEKAPNEMLGERHVEKYGLITHFLLKYLDSAIRLHIQCHPTIPFAKKHLNSNSGKTEAYIILGFREEIVDPYIYLGFQNPPSKEEFKRIIEEQDIDAMLGCFEKIPVKEGDVFIVPGGLPHAIGEGVFMIELMEPTDWVARIEFERGGYVLPEASRFMDRGIDFALSMFNYNAISPEEIKSNFFCNARVLEQQDGSTEYVLIDEEQTPCFQLNRLVVKGTYVKTSASFYIAIVTKGSGVVSYYSGTSVKVEKGSRFFVPAKSDAITFLSDESMELIIAIPPKS